MLWEAIRSSLICVAHAGAHCSCNSKKTAPADHLQQPMHRTCTLLMHRQHVIMLLKQHRHTQADLVEGHMLRMLLTWVGSSNVSQVRAVTVATSLLNGEAKIMKAMIQIQDTNNSKDSMAIAL